MAVPALVGGTSLMHLADHICATSRRSIGYIATLYFPLELLKPHLVLFWGVSSLHAKRAELERWLTIAISSWWTKRQSRAMTNRDHELWLPQWFGFMCGPRWSACRLTRPRTCPCGPRNAFFQRLRRNRISQPIARNVNKHIFDLFIKTAPSRGFGSLSEWRCKVRNVALQRRCKDVAFLLQTLM